MNLSVLQNASTADVRSKPFPHVVIHNALPPEVCDELIASYPDPTIYGTDMTQNNVRYDYPAHQAMRDERIPVIWRDLLNYQTSPAFFADVVRVFGDHILRLYGNRFASLEELASMRVGVRGDDSFDDKDLLMEAQISGNTPVSEPSVVRGLHVDMGNKLFSGLLYLRPDDDDTAGGDLEIWRFKPGLSAEKRLNKVRYDLSIDPKDAKLVSTVRYDKNVLVLFINTMESLHGVSPRSPTSTPRIFMNLIAEVSEPLYIPTALMPKTSTVKTPPLWRRAASGVKRALRG